MRFTEIIDSVEQAINNIVKAPQRLAKRATKQVVDFEANLENYLRNTNKEELNPEGIKRDLQLLLSSPRAGLRETKFIPSISNAGFKHPCYMVMLMYLIYL